MWRAIYTVVCTAFMVVRVHVHWCHVCSKYFYCATKSCEIWETRSNTIDVWDWALWNIVIKAISILSTKSKWILTAIINSCNNVCTNLFDLCIHAYLWVCYVYITFVINYLGLGAKKGRDDEWIAGQEEFENLLATLSSQSVAVANSEDLSCHQIKGIVPSSLKRLS